MGTNHYVTVHGILEGCTAYACDPLGWRTALVRGLREALNAPIAMTTEVHAVWSLEKARVLFHVDEGWLSEAQQLCFVRYQVDGANRIDPLRAALAERQGEIVVGAASSLLDFDAYRAGEVFQRYMKPAGTGDMLTATTAIGDLSDDRWSIFSCVRLEGDEPFDEDDLRLAGLLAEALRERVGTSLADASSPLCGLTERLRAALVLLMSDRSEAEAADAMGVKPSTFHGYVQALYRTFGVSGRAGLQAWFYGRGRVWSEAGPAGSDRRLARLRREKPPMMEAWRARASLTRKT